MQITDYGLLVFIPRENNMTKHFENKNAKTKIISWSLPNIQFYSIGPCDLQTLSIK